MNVFVVRAHYGQHTDAFREHGYAGIGWFDQPLAAPHDKAAIRARYEQVYTDQSPNAVSQNVGQIDRFYNAIHDGDIVITPYNDGRLLVGRVEGPVYFEQDGTSPYASRRRVAWLSETLDRHNLSIPLQNTLGSSLTVYNVSQVGEVCEAANIPYATKDGAAAPVVKEARRRGLDGIYEAIRATLLELHDQEFETLVSYVLRTLGFEATQETGRVGDGGIDFEGELRVLGIASIHLQVQVKRYKAQRINETDIRNFRGALKRDYQGCFITLSSFAKKARASAADPHKVPVNLINGRQFIDIITEKYDSIMDLMLEEDNDELAEKLKFKRVLIPG